MKPNPKYRFQGEARDAVLASFKTADRAQLIMACGTGFVYPTSGSSD